MNNVCASYLMSVTDAKEGIAPNVVEGQGGDHKDEPTLILGRLVSNIGHGYVDCGAQYIPFCVDEDTLSIEDFGNRGFLFLLVAVTIIVVVFVRVRVIVVVVVVGVVVVVVVMVTTTLSGEVWVFLVRQNVLCSEG